VLFGLLGFALAVQFELFEMRFERRSSGYQ
jgi:hypothetical protein